MLQRLLETTSLTGDQWLTVLGLSLIPPAAVAVDKLLQHAGAGTHRSGT
jgi:Ca2+-transporting ATPase